jgi:hypothetical protein
MQTRNVTINSSELPKTFSICNEESGGIVLRQKILWRRLREDSMARIFHIRALGAGLFGMFFVERMVVV